MELIFMSKRANGEGTVYKAPYKTKSGKERSRWIGQYYDKEGNRKTEVVLPPLWNNDIGTFNVIGVLV